MRRASVNFIAGFEQDLYSVGKTWLARDKSPSANLDCIIHIVKDVEPTVQFGCVGLSSSKMSWEPVSEKTIRSNFIFSEHGTKVGAYFMISWTQIIGKERCWIGLRSRFRGALSRQLCHITNLNLISLDARRDSELPDLDWSLSHQNKFQCFLIRNYLLMCINRVLWFYGKSLVIVLDKLR